MHKIDYIHLIDFTIKNEGQQNNEINVLQFLQKQKKTRKMKNSMLVFTLPHSIILTVFPFWLFLWRHAKWICQIYFVFSRPASLLSLRSLTFVFLLCVVIVRIYVFHDIFILHLYHTIALVSILFHGLWAPFYNVFFI